MTADWLWVLKKDAADLDNSIRNAAFMMWQLRENTAATITDPEGLGHRLSLQGLVGWGEYHAQLVSLRASL